MCALNKEDKFIDWFFVVNDNCTTFLEMAKVAVFSAESFRINKYCIYSGSSDEFVKSLESHHVKVIRHSFSLGNEIRAMRPDIYKRGCGSYLRIDIPDIILKNSLPVGDHYLYTDCDIIFQNDPVPALLKLRSKTFFASSESLKFQTNFFNAGVMWINLSNANKTAAKLKDFIIKHKFSFETYKQGTFDQGALNLYYKYRYDFMDLRFNWKPYWGKNENAFIIHFHGPKPRHYLHYKRTKEVLDPAFQRFFKDQTNEAYDFYINKFFDSLELYTRRLYVMPDDFDWQQYIVNYPDLQKVGIKTKVMAEKHWIEHGSSEKRSYKKMVN